MPVVIDHVFVWTAAGAPAAIRLGELGFTEGPSNRHPGQSTANRRFFFRSTMLELLWVDGATEAREQADPRLRLWERWSARSSGASPFGIILRPAEGSTCDCPFRSWEYRPETMPELALQIAADTGLDEPMWCFMDNVRVPAAVPREHPNGVGEITGVRIVCPPRAESITSQMATQRLITLEAGPEHLMGLQFDGGHRLRSFDLRPDLPLIVTY
jgi:hypothetical protein